MNVKRSVKRILSVIVVFTVFFVQITQSVSAMDELRDEQAVAESILSNMRCEPLTSLSIGGGKAFFEYNAERIRISLKYEGIERHFRYDGDRLIEQEDSNYRFRFFGEENEEGFWFRDNEYFFARDEIGSVTKLCNSSGTVLCDYVYIGTRPTVVMYSENEDDIEACNRNPYRYKGWYYDVELGMYYLGEGVFFDPEQEMTIHNPFQVTVRGGTPTILQDIANAYSAIINSPNYGITAYNYVSESQWNSGQRWYDGIAQIELIARCVYAENNGLNRQDDRKAIGMVIRNRVAQGFPHVGALSAYSIVTFASAFSSINPGNYNASITETAIARSAMSVTNSAFQQATLIACTLYYSNDASVYAAMNGTLSYVSTSHTHFLQLDYVYIHNTFSVTGSGSNIQWKYGSVNIYGVCVAGTAMLTSFYGSGAGSLQAYYSQGYNVFYYR
ncbi:MAG: hypothetical protein IK055_08055 [Lachnospiraceae bacterium]|nr:hypothetical protein [Lachnospiraceae bacterium]